jgi:hypothetical protein
MAAAPVQRISWSRVVLTALAAGLVGGAFLDAYLSIAPLASAHPAMAATWTTIAVAAFGKGMLSNGYATWIGLAVHALVSIAWAGAYAYAAASAANVRRRWYISGPVFGTIVYLLMQIVLLVSGNFEYPHSPDDFVSALIAHAIFFGLPVAFVVNALDRG